MLSDPVAIAGWVVLIAALAISAGAGVSARRRGAPMALATGGAIALLGGIVTAGLATGHLSAVAIVELRRAPVQYEFRVYAPVAAGDAAVHPGVSTRDSRRGRAERKPHGVGARARRGDPAAGRQRAAGAHSRICDCPVRLRRREPPCTAGDSATHDVKIAIAGGSGQVGMILTRAFTRDDQDVTGPRPRTLSSVAARAKIERMRCTGWSALRSWRARHARRLCLLNHRRALAPRDS